MFREICGDHADDWRGALLALCAATPPERQTIVLALLDRLAAEASAKAGITTLSTRIAPWNSLTGNAAQGFAGAGRIPYRTGSPSNRDPDASVVISIRFQSDYRVLMAPPILTLVPWQSWEIRRPTSPHRSPNRLPNGGRRKSSDRSPTLLVIPLGTTDLSCRKCANDLTCRRSARTGITPPLGRKKALS